MTRINPNAIAIAATAGTLLLTGSAFSDNGTAALPWKTNTPIVSVQKDLYKKHPAPRVAALASVQYVGNQLERREVQGIESESDVAQKIAARWSLDNGRTWSEFVVVQPSNTVMYQGVKVWEGEGTGIYDLTSRRFVQLWLRQIEVRGAYHNFTYFRTSGDLGRTWSQPRQLKYETGSGFDPQEPLKSGFINYNEGLPGNNILIRSDGKLVVCLAHTNAQADSQNNQRPWRMGSVLLLSAWNPAAGNYEWTTGARVEISPETSARGLMEPEVAELKDRRLLVVWRGSTVGWDGTIAKLPGRKLFSISNDGGRTLTSPSEWKYDDGSSFYSPSSFHRTIRHSITGKLYWLGNICGTPPHGNSPRYPLVIAEVNETTATLRRNSVTAIDDRRAGQGDIQFSNFSLLENRETHVLELLLTTYGQEPAPADWATADSYRYVLKLKK